MNILFESTLTRDTYQSCDDVAGIISRGKLIVNNYSKLPVTISKIISKVNAYVNRTADENNPMNGIQIQRSQNY